MQTIILIHPELLCIAKILSFGAEQRAKEEKKKAVEEALKNSKSDVPKSEERRKAGGTQDSVKSA